MRENSHIKGKSSTKEWFDMHDQTALLVESLQSDYFNLNLQLNFEWNEAFGGMIIQ